MMLYLLLCTAALPWYDQKLQGWYYFEENDASSSEIDFGEAERALEYERVLLKELLALALLSPTEENVKNYWKRQQLWNEQSDRFAEASKDATP